MKNIMKYQRNDYLRNKCFSILIKYKYKISFQKYRTYKGQIKAGDYSGFLKGIKNERW